MKKALMLVGLILCTTAGFTAETGSDLSSDGKKRNEEAYEKMLEQTGWKSNQSNQQNCDDAKQSRERAGISSQPNKSS